MRFLLCNSHYVYMCDYHCLFQQDLLTNAFLFCLQP